MGRISHGKSSYYVEQCRIAILGRNGSGKTTLLKMLQGLYEPSFGTVSSSGFGYVPQIVTGLGELSSGERFNKALTGELLKDPTNHLDVAQ